ncbi:hypothetical protein NQD34_002985 [Periophthalmus magnuspinnatus]|nr:hypothetical protein NQD34_002985 [Periophthalmus magnuspinnatus]
MPVYVVKPERQDGPSRTLHRDLLLPCGFLPAVNQEPSAEASSVSKPRTRQQCQTSPDSEDSAEDLTPVTVVPSLLRFQREGVHQVQKPSCNVPENNPSAQSSPVTEPTADEITLESDNKHLPEEETHLPESEPVEQPVELPTEDHLPEILPDSSRLESAEVPLTDNTEVHSETCDSNSDSVEPKPEQIPRRSVRQRLPPDRLQYGSLCNPLISVVQTLLHSLSDALSPHPTANSPIHMV